MRISQWIASVIVLGIGLSASRAQCQPACSIDTLPTSIAGVEVALPPPSLVDGLDAASQSAALRQVAGKYPLERFARNSLVAPFTLKRETIKDAKGQRVGHQVDLWFIAYGPLDVIVGEDLFRTMVDAQQGDDLGKGQRVSDETLARRGIKTIATPDTDEAAGQLGYYRFSVPVLDRVRVDGVVRTCWVSSPESHFASIALEEAFAGDDQYPNQWRPVDSDVADAAPYSGYGAYAKATKLKGYAGAVLIECHAVMHEPEGWFGRANLLGSKLPIAAQNAVRRFRRALSKHAQ